MSLSSYIKLYTFFVFCRRMRRYRVGQKNTHLWFCTPDAKRCRLVGNGVKHTLFNKCNILENDRWWVLFLKKIGRDLKVKVSSKFYCICCYHLPRGTDHSKTDTNTLYWINAIFLKWSCDESTFCQLVLVAIFMRFCFLPWKRKPLGPVIQRAMNWMKGFENHCPAG